MRNFFLRFGFLFAVLVGFASSSVADNKWSLDQNSFQLLSNLVENRITIGDLVDFSFVLTAKEEIVDDVLIVEMSASYNGFSSLLFCGVPQVETSDKTVAYARYGSTYDAVFEGISYDSYIFDFGTISAKSGDTITFEFEMLVADNALYVEGAQYWMGVGVEFDHSQSIWVNDIAFQLAPKPVSLQSGVKLGDENDDEKSSNMTQEKMSHLLPVLRLNCNEKKFSGKHIL